MKCLRACIVAFCVHLIDDKPRMLKVYWLSTHAIVEQGAREVINNNVWCNRKSIQVKETLV